MLLPMLVVWRVRAASTGYLYSPHSKGFIGRDGDLLRLSKAPLRFAVRMFGSKAMLFTDERGEEPRSLDGGDLHDPARNERHPRNLFTIQMNKKGEIRFKNGDVCQGITGGYLKAQRCSRKKNQRFYWIPEALYNQARTRHAPRSDSEEDVPEEDPEQECDEAEGAGSEEERPHKHRRPRKFHARRASEDAEPETPTERHRYHRRPQRRTKKPMGMGLASSEQVAPPETTVSEIPPPPKRRRGIFAEGYERNNKCVCRDECIRNPKNKECYYEMNGDGGLAMVKKPCRCQYTNSVCATPNQLENGFCEMFLENNYAAFSDVLDKILYD